MKYQTLHLIYFSPTCTSEKIARAVAQNIDINCRLETNLTYDFSESPILIKDELVIIAVPVYAGRVAPVALKRLERLKGENSSAILAVIYGNRDYEDALVELRDTITRQGFSVVSAGAFIGEHSYSRKDMPIAAGRPDEKDLDCAVSFGRDSVCKLSRMVENGYSSPFFIKGNSTYREVAASSPSAPETLQDICNNCGVCIDLCPTQAIGLNSEGVIDTDKMKCIKCCACVKGCSSEARIFNTPYTAILHQKCSSPKSPELFF